MDKYGKQEKTVDPSVRGRRFRYASVSREPFFFIKVIRVQHL